MIKQEKILEKKKVTKYGTGAHIVLPKSFIGQTIYAIPERYSSRIENLFYGNIQKSLILSDVLSKEEIERVKAKMQHVINRAPNGGRGLDENVPYFKRVIQRLPTLPEEDWGNIDIGIRGDYSDDLYTIAMTKAGELRKVSKQVRESQRTSKEVKTIELLEEKK